MVSTVSGDFFNFILNALDRAIITVDKIHGNMIMLNREAKRFAPGSDVGMNFFRSICGRTKPCEHCPIYAETDESVGFKCSGSEHACSFAQVLFKDVLIDNRECVITVWNRDGAQPSLYFIPEVNIADGLKSFSGQMDGYMNILKVYYDVGSDKLSLIKELHEKKDIHDLRIEVHGLKGTSYVIGANDLGDLAKACEYACRDIEGTDDEAVISENESFLDAHIPKLLFDYERMLRSIEPFISAEEEIHTEQRSPEEIDELISQGLDKLDEYELDDASDILDKLSATDLSPDDKLILGKSMREFKNYDYDKTAYYLKQLQEKRLSR